jgi:hypothetical protein
LPPFSLAAGRLGSGYDFRKGHETVKAIYPVALTLPTEGGGRYAAAQIYDWTITNSRKPEMAINYFFARMGLFGGAVVNYRRDGASLRARRTRKFSAAPKPAICQSRMRPTTRSM